MIDHINAMPKAKHIVTVEGPGSLARSCTATRSRS
jgi:hypothetical protein